MYENIDFFKLTMAVLAFSHQLRKSTLINVSFTIIRYNFIYFSPKWSKALSIIKISIASVSMLTLASFMAFTDEGEAETDKVVEKYQLSINETKMMNQCENAMVTHKVIFKDGATQTSGCGCIISQVSPKLSHRQMTMATGLLPVLFEARNHDNVKKYEVLSAGVTKFQAITRLNEKKTDKVLNKLFDAVAFCGKNASAI